MTGRDPTWADRSTLLAAQGREGGWGYRPGANPCAEPSALAGLALLATRDVAGPGPTGDPGASAARAAAAWLGSLQRPDGSVGLSDSLPEPGWATPYAVLLWKATGGHDDRCRAAARWLLGQKGRALSRGDDPLHVAGHDTSLVGWPWVADTHSWLEPTAAAVLALGRLGLAGHPRVREGLRLIRDREVDSGGWNYGNKAVFGRVLRAQPAPTGLALLALCAGGTRPEGTGRAVRYLLGVLPGVRAPASLGWGLVGLRACGERPDEADGWLAESFAAATARPDAPVGLACLLLATGPGTLGLFGNAERPDAGASAGGNP